MTLRAAECYFRASDGALVHFDARDAEPEARGVCVTLHGMGEHLEKYDEWARYAVERGYNITSYDQRGHGLTSGRRGDFEFADLVADLDRFVTVSADRYPDLPLFVLAHSLGGLVALKYAAGATHSALAGMALSGPPLVLVRRHPPWYPWLIRGLARVAPWVPLPRGTDPSRLTRDPDRLEALRRDPYFHRVITPRAMLGIAEAMQTVRMTPEKVSIPLLFLVARADTVVSGADVLAYAHFVASKDVSIEQYPGAYHELLNDLGRRAVFDRICTWFDGRVS